MTILAPEHLRTLALASNGYALDRSPERFGWLRESTDAFEDVEELRRRLDQDGYLYLPGYLDRSLALDARRAICERLAAAGHLKPGTDPGEAIARLGSTVKFAPELAEGNAALMELLYAGRMIALYERLLGGPILYFDFTWLRAIAPGKGTKPHGDSVFMNRGTHNLYTSWTPLGDIDLRQGGLIVLEGSHRFDEINDDYGMRDVDAYCLNDPNAETYAAAKDWMFNGTLTEDPVALARDLDRRWLTAEEFRAGDLLLFTIFTLHASLDNQSDRVRISSDSRYQLASEPADERWVGPNPVGHGPEGKKGLIC